jgi:hypothetical protein
MEAITKEWPREFLVPVEQTELSNPDLIGSPIVTREEYDGPSSSRKKCRKLAMHQRKLHQIHQEEEDMMK